MPFSFGNVRARVGLLAKTQALAQVLRSQAEKLSTTATPGEVAANFAEQVDALRQELDRTNELVEQLKEWAEVREGTRGTEPLEKAATLRDLVGLSVTSQTAIDILLGGGVPPAEGSDPGSDDPIGPPPTPSTLSVTPTISAFILTWNFSLFNGLAYFEIFVNTTNTLGTAVKIGQTAAQQFIHEVGGAQTRFYWVRAVNVLGVIGAFNSGTGTSGTTPNNVTDLIPPLAVTNAMIGSLAANKISAGYINAAIGINGASVYGTDLYAGGSVTVNFDGFGNVIGFTPVNPTLQIVGGVADFNATAFRIRNGAGGFGTPFQVIGSVVYINNAVIQASSITTDKIQVGAVTATAVEEVSIVDEPWPNSSAVFNPFPTSSPAASKIVTLGPTPATTVGIITLTAQLELRFKLTALGSGFGGSTVPYSVVGVVGLHYRASPGGSWNLLADRPFHAKEFTILSAGTIGYFLDYPTIIDIASASFVANSAYEFAVTVTDIFLYPRLTPPGGATLAPGSSSFIDVEVKLLVQENKV